MNKQLIDTAMYSEDIPALFLLLKDVKDRFMINGLLKQACIMGSLCLVRFLIDKEAADVRYTEETPLRYACEHGHLHIVRYLVEFHHCNIHAADECCLRWACRNGHSHIIKYILKLNPNIDARNCGAIRNACFHGHPDCVYLLLNAKAKADENVLLTAIKGENLKVLHLLWDYHRHDFESEFIYKTVNDLKYKKKHIYNYFVNCLYGFY